MKKQVLIAMVLTALAASAWGQEQGVRFELRVIQDGEEMDRHSHWRPFGEQMSIELGDPDHSEGHRTRLQATAEEPRVGNSEVTASVQSRQDGEWVEQWSLEDTLAIDQSPSFEVEIGDGRVLEVRPREAPKPMQ